MSWAIGLSLWVIRCSDALAEVVSASAFPDQADIPHADGQPTFSFPFQESGQLGNEVGEDVANEGLVLLHSGRVARPDLV